MVKAGCHNLKNYIHLNQEEFESHFVMQGFSLTKSHNMWERNLETLPNSVVHNQKIFLFNSTILPYPYLSICFLEKLLVLAKLRPFSYASDLIPFFLLKDISSNYSSWLLYYHKTCYNLSNYCNKPHSF